MKGGNGDDFFHLSRIFLEVPYGARAAKERATIPFGREV